MLSLHHHSFLFVGSHCLEGGRSGAHNCPDLGQCTSGSFWDRTEGVLWEWPGRKGQGQTPKITCRDVGIACYMIKIRVQKLCVCVIGNGRKLQNYDAAHTCQQVAEPEAVAVLAISGTQIKSKSQDL